jgi:hypothetical protein
MSAETPPAGGFGLRRQPLGNEGVPEAPSNFTVLDWLGTVVTAFVVVALLLFPLVGHAFGATYRDLGSDELPMLTKLAISVWFPVLWGMIVVVGIVFGVWRASPLWQRRAAIVGAFFVGLVGIGVCLVGVYWPLFALASTVK